MHGANTVLQVYIIPRSVVSCDIAPGTVCAVSYHNNGDMDSIEKIIIQFTLFMSSA